MKGSLYFRSLKRPSGARGEDFNLCWQPDSLLPLMSSQSSRTEPELRVQLLILLRVEKNLLSDTPSEIRVMKFFCQTDRLQTCIRIASLIYCPDMCLHFIATVKDGSERAMKQYHKRECCSLVMSGGTSVLFQTVIFVPLQYHELLILSCGPFSLRLHFLEMISISTHASKRPVCSFLYFQLVMRLQPLQHQNAI